MYSNGSPPLWASSLVFGLLLLVIYAILSSTNPHPTQNNFSPAIPVTGSAVQVNGNTYLVRPGDTLDGLALRFQTTVSALLQANPQITDPRLIFPGQRLTIP